MLSSNFSIVPKSCILKQCWGISMTRLIWECSQNIDCWIQFILVTEDADADMPPLEDESANAESEDKARMEEVD